MIEDLKIKFGEKLKLLRTRQKFSQERLGELAGISTNYVGQIERAERNISIEKIALLANALKVEAKELFNFRL